MTSNQLAGHTALITGSLFLERLAFYGSRAILLLYMVGPALSLSNIDAASIYGTFIIAFYLAKLPGGIIGDLIGSKWALLIGGSCEAAGLFLLSSGTGNLLWPALIGIIVGNALYSPALFARLGRIWLDRPQKMDAAFSLNYILINLGAIVGMMVIIDISESSYEAGFRLAASILFLATLLCAFLPAREPAPTSPTKAKSPFLPTMLIILLSAVFWFFYEWGQNAIYNYMQTGGLSYAMNMLPGIIIIIISFVAALCWFLLPFRSTIKMGVGALLTAIGFFAFFLLGSTGTTIYTTWLIATILISTGEVFVSPILHSALSQFTPPKYLASCFGLTLTFIYLGRLLLPYLDFASDTMTLILSGLGMCITALVIFMTLVKKARGGSIRTPGRGIVIMNRSRQV